MSIVSSVGFGIENDAFNEYEVGSKINGKSLKHTIVGIAWL